MNPRILYINLGIFLLVLSLGAYFRFTGRDWGTATYRLEREEDLIFLQKNLELPKSLSNYFEARSSPLNPALGDYGLASPIYGSFSSTLARLFLGDTRTSSADSVRHSARTLAAIFDVLVMLIIGIAGIRTFGFSTGILAMGIYGLFPLQITEAHVFSSAWLALLPQVLLLLVLLPRSGNRNPESSMFSFICFGILFGAAVAADPRNLILGATLPFAFLIRGMTTESGTHVRVKMEQHPIGSALFYTVMALISFWVTFRICQPYAFEPGSLLELNHFFLKAGSDLLYGETAPIATLSPIEWSLSNRLFKIYQFSMWGFGPLVFIFLLLSLFGTTLPRAIVKGKIALLPLFTITLAFYVLSLFETYPNPSTLHFAAPAISLLVAEGLLSLFAASSQRLNPQSTDLKPNSRNAFIVLSVIYLGAGTWSAVLNGALFKQENPPFEAASFWIEEHVAKGKTIVVEHNSPRLPGSINGKTPGPYRFSEINLLARDFDENDAFFQAQMKKADLLVFSSSASEETAALLHGQALTYFDKLRAEASPFRLEAEFHCTPRVLGWDRFASWVPVEVRESFCPRVSVFLPRK